MKSIREFIDIVAEQSGQMVKVVRVSWDQTGEYVQGVETKEVLDPERFVQGTAKKLQQQYGDEFYGDVTSDSRGAWAMGLGETQVMIVLDSLSPWYTKFVQGQQDLPQGFWDYYLDNLS